MPPPQVVPRFSTLTAAASLQRAACAHLAEELSARQVRGHLATRELANVLSAACDLHSRLVRLAAQDGGQP
jgi:hypothetical protein